MSPGNRPSGSPVRPRSMTTPPTTTNKTPRRTKTRPNSCMLGVYSHPCVVGIAALLVQVIARLTHVPAVLETVRLIRREFEPEDTDDLARILSDPETMRYYQAPYDQAGVERWIARNRERDRDDGVGLWAMILKSCGELIGD